MFAQTVQRAQVGEVLFGRRSPGRLERIDAIDHLGEPEPLSVIAVWAQEPKREQDPPAFLLTADGAERDWLSWLVTFAPSLRPLTAFCRVMTARHFISRLATLREPDLGNVGNACIGLILGEVLASEDGARRSKEPLTASACASVLSFALVRALAIHADEANTVDLAARWLAVRKLTRQRDREIDIRSVYQVADTLGHVLRRESSSTPLATSPLADACRELADTGEITRTHGISPLLRLTPEMRGTREERVAIVERAVELSLGAPTGPEEAFAIGFLASRINPGTLTHAPLLGSVLRRHPAAMLWYGVCAGLNRDGNIMAELGGVGRRVIRDLLTPVEMLSRPRVDVAANELELLLMGGRSDDFPVTSPTQLSVELDPGIWTVVNWSSRIRVRRQEADMRKPERREDRTWIAEEIEDTIMALSALRYRLMGRDYELDERDAPEGTQRDLFDRKPEKKGRRR